MQTIEHYRRLIADSGMTDYAIAQLTGLSANTVASVRRGDGNPTLATLESIRVVLEAKARAT